MPRQKVQNTPSIGPRTHVHDIVLRDPQSSQVCGRATVEATGNGKVWLLLRQTYGGSVDGTLKGDAVRCDLDVLRDLVAEADKIADAVEG